MQREYLRLVADGKTSKEIAQLRGGSHHTINAEIGVAMRIMGETSRGAAAAKFATFENSDSYERSYEPDVVACTAKKAPEPDREEAGDANHHLLLPVPTGKQPTNELTTWQRIGWIVAIATTLALLVGGLASGVTALLEGVSRWA